VKDDFEIGGKRLDVPMIPLFANCHIPHETRCMMAQPNYNIQSGMSADSSRVAFNGIGRAQSKLTAGNVCDVCVPCDAFRFADLTKFGHDRQCLYISFDANARQEIRLLRAATADCHVT
jgi:hypothetical protein